MKLAYTVWAATAGDAAVSNLTSKGDGTVQALTGTASVSGTVGVGASDASEAQQALATYTALDTTVVRGLASATAEAMTAVMQKLQQAGVTAVSQTAGPETALCGEADLPYALLGFVTDYANGVSPEPTPVASLGPGETGYLIAGIVLGPAVLGWRLVAAAGHGGRE